GVISGTGMPTPLRPLRLNDSAVAPRNPLIPIVPPDVPTSTSAVAVASPVLSTFHLEAPPTCKSSRSDPAPDAVLVTFSKIPASTTPVVFQVGVICSEGSVCEPVSEFTIPTGTAVDPARVSNSVMY